MTVSTSVPPTRREDVVDTYHTTAVGDPYRWLEEGDDAEVVAWVATQNALTRSALDVPDRAASHQRLVALMELPVLQHAALRGANLFCFERPAGAEQFVLVRRTTGDPASEPVVLLDPASSSEDAATAIDWYFPSNDGSLVAVGLSEGGTEQSVLHLISGTDGSPAGGDGDRIPDTRACSVAWEPDGSGFFYIRYPADDEYNRTVHHHRLGADSRDDPVVWDDRPDPQAWPHVTLTPDGRWLIVHVEVGYQRTDVHVLDRRHDDWATVVTGVDAAASFSVSSDGMSLVGITNLGAPHGRVVRVRLDGDVLRRGPDAWATIVAERDDVIAQLAVTRATVCCSSTSAGAVDVVHRIDPAGRHLDIVGGLGDSISVAEGGLATDVDLADAYVIVDSYVEPTALWSVPASGPATPATSGSDAEVLTGGLSVGESSYPSADGTRDRACSWIHRADVIPSAETPAILNGYGGFTITLSPAWQPGIAAWCAAGGLYAVAGLRGGHDHGEAWHVAGSRGNKQNVFDDFHAAADHLVDFAFATLRDVSR